MQKHFPRKRFGQHFLTDRHVIHKIIAAISPEKDQIIVEIGPGLGALTVEILQETGHLIAIELDRDLISQLTNQCQSYGELKLYQADALAFDYSQLVESGQKLRLVGNLPYNISTPLLFHLLNFENAIHDMHFMLQQEVVSRMVAEVGSANYGRLSVMIQYFCEATELFSVDAHAFDPPPAVTSAIIKLVPLHEKEHRANDIKRFTMIVAEAFNQRRKTLRNSLKRIIPANQLEKIGINPELRPQQLSVAEFVNISNHATYVEL